MKSAGALRLDEQLNNIRMSGGKPEARECSAGRLAEDGGGGEKKVTAMDPPGAVERYLLGVGVNPTGVERRLPKARLA
jgi:hypothetical protein